MITRRDFTNLVTDLAERQKFVTTQLTQCPEGTLQHTYRDQQQIFFQAVNNCGKRKRIRINKNPDMIDGLARKKYLEVESGLLHSNIIALNTLLERYMDPTADNILERLPSRYKNLPERHFLTAYKDPTGMEKSFQNWKDAPFEQSTYRPQEKTHTTIHGLKVRSKSEVIIAERLYAYALPFRYEEMIYFRQYSFSPDFTILTARGLKYWEHCGKVNDPNYMRHHNWKMKIYDIMGIVPWKNLIVTYDDVLGGIDSRIIESEIINKLL